MEKMQKLNLRMQKLNFPGTHWRGLALIGAQKKPLILLCYCIPAEEIKRDISQGHGWKPSLNSLKVFKAGFFFVHTQRKLKGAKTQKNGNSRKKLKLKKK